MNKAQWRAALAAVVVALSGSAVFVATAPSATASVVPSVAAPAARAGEVNVGTEKIPAKNPAKDKAPAVKKQSKGKPPAPCAAGPCYRYAGARWNGGATLKDGATSRMQVRSPALCTDTYHSLSEVAVESADGQQIVEIGWTVDKVVNGDTKPRLFTYYWINGVGQGYNTATDFSAEPKNQGMDMTPYLNSQVWFKALHSGTDWFLGIDVGDGTGTHWVAYLEDFRWTNLGAAAFQKTPYVQVFGEIAERTDTGSSAKQDMGNGVLASSTAGTTNGSFNTYAGGTGGLTAYTGSYQDTANGYGYTALSTFSYNYGGGGSPQAVGC